MKWSDFRKFRNIDWNRFLKNLDDVNITTRDVEPAPSGWDAVECPELQKTISFVGCFTCKQYKIWDKDDGIRRCYYEYMELKSQGHYNGLSDLEQEDSFPDHYEEMPEEVEVEEREEEEDEDIEDLEESSKYFDDEPTPETEVTNIDEDDDEV